MSECRQWCVHLHVYHEYLSSFIIFPTHISLIHSDSFVSFYWRISVFYYHSRSFAILLVRSLLSLATFILGPRNVHSDFSDVLERCSFIEIQMGKMLLWEYVDRSVKIFDIAHLCYYH